MDYNDYKYGVIDFICNNDKGKAITPERIKKDLYPELELNDIRQLFKDLSKLDVVDTKNTNGRYLFYRFGLDDYLISLKNRPIINDNNSPEATPKKKYFSKGEVIGIVAIIISIILALFL